MRGLGFFLDFSTSEHQNDEKTTNISEFIVALQAY